MPTLLGGRIHRRALPELVWHLLIHSAAKVDGVYPVVATVTLKAEAKGLSTPNNRPFIQYARSHRHVARSPSTVPIRHQNEDGYGEAGKAYADIAKGCITGKRHLAA
jgi:hypothetical protein